MAVELYDDHEQSERVRNWISENGVSIVMGVVLALAGIFGFRQWQDYKEVQANLANEYYVAVQREIDAGEIQAASDQFERMREASGEHPYLALAGMQVAAALAGEDELDSAAELLGDLLGRNDWPSLQPMLRLRLAVIETARGRSEAALTLLSGAPPAGFDGLWMETRGDVLLDLGRLDEAVQAYQAAVTRYEGEGNNTRLARIKLDHARSAAGTEANANQGSGADSEAETT
ncbi:MAG: YfgM family protein [Wenzhouxiangellaceae bacterium]